MVGKVLPPDLGISHDLFGGGGEDPEEDEKPEEEDAGEVEEGEKDK